MSEAEGLTRVVAVEDATKHGLVPSFVAAWLALDVPSGLASVGLTSAVSTALADATIPCNVLAGYHHDHLLVPVKDAERAIAVLEGLAEARRHD